MVGYFYFSRCENPRNRLDIFCNGDSHCHNTKKDMAVACHNLECLCKKPKNIGGIRCSEGDSGGGGRRGAKLTRPQGGVPPGHV